MSGTARANSIPVITFTARERKADVMVPYLHCLAIGILRTPRRSAAGCSRLLTCGDVSQFS
jgi:hypothetical protein